MTRSRSNSEVQVTAEDEYEDGSIGMLGLGLGLADDDDDVADDDSVVVVDDDDDSVDCDVSLDIS